MNWKSKNLGTKTVLGLWLCCSLAFFVLDVLGFPVTLDMLLQSLMAIGVVVTLAMFLLVTWRIQFLGNRLGQIRKEVIAKQAKLFADDQIPDRTTVNAALIKLAEVQGNDTESAGIVIRFASRMLPVELDAREYVDPKPSGTSFRGLTAEMGEMEFREDKPEPEVVSKGFYRERAGQFILTRTLDVLVYRHHLKGTQATAGRPEDLAQGHVVIFSPDKMEYVGFGNINIRHPSEDSPLFAIVAEVVYGVHTGDAFQIPTEI